jgi:hypothetical protein
MRTKFFSVAPKFFGGPQYGNYFMSLLRHLTTPKCGACNFGKFHAALHLIVLIHLMKNCKRQWSANSNRFYPDPVLTCQWCNLPSLTRLCGPCNSSVTSSALVMLDTPSSEVVWRVLATQSIRQFPLHFPSRASPCAVTFQLDSTFKAAKQVCKGLTSDRWWWWWWWWWRHI